MDSRVLKESPDLTDPFDSYFQHNAVIPKNIKNENIDNGSFVRPATVPGSSNFAKYQWNDDDTSIQKKISGNNEQMRASRSNDDTKAEETAETNLAEQSVHYNHTKGVEERPKPIKPVIRDTPGHFTWQHFGSRIGNVCKAAGDEKLHDSQSRHSWGLFHRNRRLQRCLNTQASQTYCSLSEKAKEFRDEGVNTTTPHSSHSVSSINYSQFMSPTLIKPSSCSSKRSCSRSSIAGPIIDTNLQTQLRQSDDDIETRGLTDITDSPMSPNLPHFRRYMLPQTTEPLSNVNNNTLEHTGPTYVWLDDTKWIGKSHKERLFHLCGQQEPIPLHLFFLRLQRLRKVGEGVFGEVFSGFYPASLGRKPRAYKIVPIESKQLVNGEPQKTFEEIFQEVAITRCLSDLRIGSWKSYTDGFIELYNVRIGKGAYPETLKICWSEWDEEFKSENDFPEFSRHQLYVVFEFEYGGTDMESFVFQDARQAMSALLQISHVLAVGEKTLEFEHRDLHWGNVLIKPTSVSQAYHVVHGKEYKIPTRGIKIRIIDFTIARMKAQQKIIAIDLANDEQQFLGSDDEQFEVYRVMRRKNGNEWFGFCPKTNIFWISHLASKILNKGRFTASEEDILHKNFLNHLQCFKEATLDFNSCEEFIKSYLCQLYLELIH